jgi:hypothetical protein
MGAFIFRCPANGAKVQGFIAEEVPSNSEAFVSIECLACTQIHLVNPNTGRVAGEDHASE